MKYNYEDMIAEDLSRYCDSKFVRMAFAGFCTIDVKTIRKTTGLLLYKFSGTPTAEKWSGQGIPAT